MKNPALAVAGLLLMVCGLTFMFQGIGVLKGSSMTGETTWAIAGPAIAGLGLAVLLAGARKG